MTPAQDELLANLNALRDAVRSTAALRSILDDDWFNTVEGAISADSPSQTVTADPTGLLYDFAHPLRGADWFESDQELVLNGRGSEVDDAGKLALAFVGLDPLRTMLPVIESRVAAFASVPFKTEIVQRKLHELRAARFAPAFKNHLFELNVLGDLARRGVLIDIEDPATGVDGTIRLDGREILVEATNTTQRVIPEFDSVFFGDPKVEIDQVLKKVEKKVADGRQLALAHGKPTVLFLARRHMGASREAADWALEQCFGLRDFAALSGVVLSDSYRLHVTSWRPGKSPDVPLSDREVAVLNEWYGLR